MRSRPYILLLLLAQVFSHNSLVAGYGVNVTLTARWSSTSLALEGLEFLADVGAAEFEEGLKILEAQRCAPDSDAGLCWAGLLDTLCTLLPSSVHKLLTQHLATRHYSPRLEAFSKLYLQEHIPEQAAHACAVTVIDGTYVSSTNELQASLSTQSQSEHRGATTERLPIDHVLHTAESESAPTVILYGAPGTSSFHSAHSAIQQQSLDASGPDFHYIIRPVASGECLSRQDDAVSTWLSVGTGAPLQLAGYGVELFAKDTEYNQANEGPSTTTSAAASSDKQSLQHATSLTAHLEKEQGSAEALTVKELGLQTAQLVSKSKDPLAFLAAVSSRFPAVVHSISKVKVEKAFSNSIEAQSTLLASGQEFMLVNGVSMRVSENINLATLESVIRADAKLAHTLHAAGIHAIDVGNILKLRALDRSSNAAVRLDLRSPHCLWLNDLEKDPQYSEWPPFLSNFVSPANSLFGAIPKVARNAINLQLIVDPLAPSTRTILPDALQMYMQSLPVRIGVLFITPNDASSDAQLGTEVQRMGLTARELFVRLFMALQETYGPGVGWQFWYLLVSMPSEGSAAEDGAGEQSSEQVMTAFEQVWGGLPQQEGSGAFKGMNADDVVHGVQLGQFGDLEDAASQHADFVSKIGLKSGAHFAFNGKLSTFQGRQQELLYEFYGQFDYLQRKIASRDLKDTTRDIYGRFLEEEGFSPVYSDLVLFSGSQDEGLNAAGLASEVPQFQMSSGALGLESLQKAALPYLHAPGSRDNVKPVTIWLAVDLRKPEAATIVHNAAQFIAEGSAEMTRLSLLFNGAPDTSGGESKTLARFLTATMSLSSRVDKISPFLRSFSGNSGLWKQLTGGGQAGLDAAVAAAEEAGLNGAALKRALGDEGCCNPTEMQSTIASMHSICDALGLKRGQQAAITNGRLITLPDGTFLSTGEVELMQYVAYRLQPGMAVRQSLRDAQDNHRTSFQSSEAGISAGADELSSEAMSDLALLAASIAARPNSVDSDSDEQLFSPSNMQMSGRLQQIFRSEHVGRFKVSANSSTVVPVIQAAINPVSTTGRQLSHLLHYLHTSLDAEVEVILNPEEELTSLPLNSFYSFAVPQPHPVAGVATTKAQLPELPGNKVLTMSVEVPEAWLVEVVSADLDTDNLKLDDLGDAPGMEIGVELEAIMFTGACIDTAFHSSEDLHPRGTQLVLMDSQSPRREDTLVMSNLGYFQLKTTPGHWQLSLAPGRSGYMFDMVEGDLQALLQAGKDSSTAFSVIPSSPVLVHSFSGLHKRLLLRKKEEFKGQDVLQIAEKERSVAQEGEVVNIFAIASGHMYERLQKIMILSVLRHTKAKVKFWLIKNYMSPEMKRMMPLMAKEYGFEVEMVTYKWPSWLHRQTEKQRIIWAYKILFLDVLFPLNVSRIIFCDSDQIIRTDLAELFHMDLGGKPVAYTPFCDNNKEMDGYRFWKGGFWEKHLAGKPYHISALYLVDVDRLRQMAGGDMYRVIYDRLSKDPGSLSNLDQDLPNYAQHQVPIHSLPQEWLWCESWCGTATKAKAKTIDLCNNPATKEPKLQAARRIVPEWPEYDAKVTKFTEQARSVLALEDAEILSLSKIGLRSAVSSEREVVSEKREEL